MPLIASFGAAGGRLVAQRSFFLRRRAPTTGDAAGTDAVHQSDDCEANRVRRPRLALRLQLIRTTLMYTACDELERRKSPKLVATVGALCAVCAFRRRVVTPLQVSGSDVSGEGEFKIFETLNELAARDTDQYGQGASMLSCVRVCLGVRWWSAAIQMLCCLPFSLGKFCLARVLLIFVFPRRRYSGLSVLRTAGKDTALYDIEKLKADVLADLLPMEMYVVGWKECSPFLKPFSFSRQPAHS